MKHKNPFRLYTAALAVIFLLAVGLSGCAVVPADDGTMPSPESLSVTETGMATLADPEKLAAATQSCQITIDVNPSLELTVAEGLVTGIMAYNDDGSELLLDMDLIGLSAQEALAAVIAALSEAAYLGPCELQPYLILTVSSADESVDALSRELDLQARQSIENLELDCTIKSVTVTDEQVALAAGYNLSVARYLMFSHIASLEEQSIEQVIEVYQALTIGELMELFDDLETIFGQAPGDLEEPDETEPVLDWPDSLSPDQLALLQAAQEQFKLDVKAAQTVFHEGFAAIKADYQAHRETIRATYRHVDQEQYKQQMRDLRGSMLEARRAAIQVFKASMKAAQTAYQEAVSSLGLPEEWLEPIMDWLDEQEDSIEADLDDLFSDDQPDEDLDEDADEDGDADENEPDQDDNGDDPEQDNDADQDQKPEKRLNTGNNGKGKGRDQVKPTGEEPDNESDETEATATEEPDESQDNVDDPE